MADPLAMLQEFAMGKREFREVRYGGKLYYVFGEVAYPHDAKTNLGVYNKQDEYYTMESILSFWKMKDMQHTAYVRDVSGRGIVSITRVQRRDLIDFLGGGPLPKEANMLAPIPPPIPVSHLQQDAAAQQQQFEPERKKPRLEQQQQQDKKGHRIDKILDKSVDKADTSELRGLSSELPAEKVALLRSRVKNNLKNKPIDDESLIAIPTDMPMPDASSDTIGKFIKEKERVRKDRTTCLESQSRDFSGILTALKDIQVRENQAKMQTHHQQHPSSLANQSSTGSVNASQSSKGGAQRASIPSGYSRYDQEIFQRETVTDFEIETDLSFHGNAAMNQMTNNSPQKISSNSSSLPQTTLSNGLQHKMAGNDHRSAPFTTGSADNVAGQRQSSQQKRASRTPIIIIPATGTSLITMYNAQDILQDLRYVSTEEKKRTYKRENELLLQIRKNGAHTVPYRVIDNPTRLKEEEWERVVAVFVQGPAWQFKGWKWNGNPVEIFTNVAAFHLKFEEQKLDPNIAKWSVSVLQLSRTKRHLDRATLHKFWETLDRHIAKSGKREWLRY